MLIHCEPSTSERSSNAACISQYLARNDESEGCIICSTWYLFIDSDLN